MTFMITYFKKKYNLTIIINSAKKPEETLQSLYYLCIKGAKKRSTLKWKEEGEKHTQYCLGLEKSRQTSIHGPLLSKSTQRVDFSHLSKIKTCPIALQRYLVISYNLCDPQFEAHLRYWLI